MVHVMRTVGITYRGNANPQLTPKLCLTNPIYAHPMSISVPLSVLVNRESTHIKHPDDT